MYYELEDELIFLIGFNFLLEEELIFLILDLSVGTGFSTLIFGAWIVGSITFLYYELEDELIFLIGFNFLLEEELIFLILDLSVGTGFSTLIFGAWIVGSITFLYYELEDELIFLIGLDF